MMSRSHVPILLWLAKQHPIRTVLELGPGEVSTPLFLDGRSFPHLERLVSLEDNAEYARGLRYDDPRWELHIVPWVAEAVGTYSLDFDLILVDNDTKNEARAATIRTIAQRQPSGLVVIHDFQNPEYQQAAESFPHRLVVDDEPEHIAVVSLWPFMP